MNNRNSREDSLTVSVVVVTYRRLWHLDQCLKTLAAQARPITEIIVVDSDPDETSRSTAEASGASYIPSGLGLGHMTTARNIGMKAAGGDIVAFIDDDAFPATDWSTWVIDVFSDPTWSAMGGRAITNPAQQPADSTTEIGTLSASGELTANFESPGSERLEVQHAIGCNMAFRRSVLESMNGFRDDYPGTALREETDLFLRLGHHGHRIAFEPRALVVHVGAPHAVGRRFDFRYQYFATRNHMQLLVGNPGNGTKAARFILIRLGRTVTALLRDLVASIVRPVATVAALFAGTVAGFRRRRTR